MYQTAIEETPMSTMILEIRSKENYTKLEEMPEIYKEAVIAVEDHRFYYHNGIDIVSITRAIVNDLKSKSFAEGGSTITQQLAKNTYFTQEKKIVRKIAEVFMALEYETECEKDQILELYLNTCYFGEGCYTVKEASDVYFDKLPIDMTDYESTMLAGIPNAPSVYAPTKNPDLARQRQRQVLDKMVEYGIISVERAQEILKG
ncbi:MAG: transglycosylase domain-containing protein [Clostridia bacterium]|nr:transglycosylase domain-containing protein [Clostridia bacterium]